MGLDRARTPGQSARRMDAAGAESILPYQWRLPGRRDGDQIRDALSEGEGQAIEEKNYFAPVFVSWEYARRVVSGKQFAARRLRARPFRLAENSAVILLSMPMGQDLPIVRYRMCDRARKRNRETGRG